MNLFFNVISNCQFVCAKFKFDQILMPKLNDENLTLTIISSHVTTYELYKNMKILKIAIKAN